MDRTEVEVIPRHVETIYCDDLRHEINGKVSIIGVYSSKLLVSSFPASLPKLCLFLKVITPAAKPFRKLAVNIFRDSEILLNSVVNDTELASYIEAENENTARADEPDIRVFTFQSVLVFSPFKVDGPCTLRVRVDTGEEELRGLSLTIEQNIGAKT